MVHLNNVTAIVLFFAVCLGGVLGKFLRPRRGADKSIIAEKRALKESAFLMTPKEDCSSQSSATKHLKHELAAIRIELLAAHGLDKADTSSNLKMAVASPSPAR